MAIITAILGIIGSALLILSALSTNRKKLIIFNLSSLVFLFAQMLLTESYVGLGAASVSIVRSIFVLWSFKNPIFNHWLTVVVFVAAHFAVFSIINDWSNISVWNFAPVIGSSLSTIAIFFTNLIYTKAFLIGAGVLWLFYEFQSGAFGQMVGESFGIVSNTIALILLIKAAVTHTEVFDPTEAITRPITTILPTLTEAIPVLTGVISKKDIQEAQTVAPSSQKQARKRVSAKARTKPRKSVKTSQKGVLNQKQFDKIDEKILQAKTKAIPVVPVIEPESYFEQFKNDWDNSHVSDDVSYDYGVNKTDTPEYTEIISD